MKTAILTALAVTLAAPARADWALNLPVGVTSISRAAYDLHMLALWICLGIGIVVFGAMLWSVIRHRKSRGAVPATFHENKRLEILWTITPLLILVAMAVPATEALVAMHDTSKADLTIKVTGQQWRWRYDYLEGGVGYFSSLDPKSSEASKRGSGLQPASVDDYLLKVDHPLVVPIGKKIRFLTTATDVIHSWWVPALGFKKDAIPGFVNEMWARIDEPGTYRGQCTELCGVGHAYMPIVLVAMAEPDYQAWLKAMQTKQAQEAAAAERTWSREELYAKGEEVYGRVCTACHQANGLGIPGVFPGLNGSPLVKGSAAAHVDRVMNGKPGTPMAAFATLLTDAEIAAVVTYERNAWDNRMGDLVQPGDVKLARK
ncbi:MAG: cytochrome c oxidase subunit II [Rhodocyclales bacterium]|nr:cytochrome c oxidase subunit II [Rhodocyclales bacterium]